MKIKYVLMDRMTREYVSGKSKINYTITAKLAEATTWNSAEEAFFCRSNTFHIVVAVQCSEVSL